MQAIFNIILNALISFSFLSLATFGIVLIFKTSSTTNFAQGMLGILGAYTTSYIIDQKGVSDFTGLPSVNINNPLSLILPILGGMLVSFIFGYLIDAVIFRKSKFTNAATKQIITMGLVIGLSGLIPVIFGETITRASFKFTDETIQLLGLGIPLHRIITLIISGIIILTIFIVLKYTKWGLGVRSVASNERIAGLMGVNTNKINALSWGIAGALGALSAITYTAAISSLSISAMTDIQINAFYASILGGFQTFYGPLIGAFILNIGQSAIPMLLVNYGLAQWGNTILYLIIMLVVLIKPNGIFGKRIVKKV
ncbi:LIV-I protein H [Acholeplasma oculi]|uniref:Branched-chain amino acid ABC transport system, permease protein LivH n=1 Tax=Acholeplasma oculi TaxID=35623 RepID=A0A061A9Z5_9MOLU|nr:branched-chain amino acid ABC transporter permease [Acholeplasma oculi]CDR30715.1 Branched-chain amino acid ABC transport system, permease protein LivH [Acholeplasma oculi]SKC34728.1 branched-chain amino acid transport system permease protein [Acholeplasma oculi]SUT89558.1 LIV-I protein H [Acholeplasma oculi]